MKKSISLLAFSALLVGLSAVPASAAITPTLSKYTGLVQSGETITVSIPDIPAGQGVYVRLCKSPALGARPVSSTCYTPEGNTMGAGSWASLDAAQIALGALDASRPIDLKVKGQFGSGANMVDCTVDGCIVFIRRDHIDGTDRTLDANIPVSFAPASDQKITPKLKAKKYKTTVYRGAKQKIALVDLKTVEGNTLTFASETPKVCSLSHGSKWLSVKFKRAGFCRVTATAAGTVDFKSTIFTWQFKVR